MYTTEMCNEGAISWRRNTFGDYVNLGCILLQMGYIYLGLGKPYFTSK
jgi:hypothetical protein